MQCSSHQSNYNVFINFLEEALQKEESFVMQQDLYRLWDQRPWMTFVPNLRTWLPWFSECTAALRWQIVTVSSSQASQILWCGQQIDKVGPVRSNTGTSEWCSWKLFFVALATPDGCTTLESCDHISNNQWWNRVKPFRHFANSARGPRWHSTTQHNRLLQ